MFLDKQNQENYGVLKLFGYKIINSWNFKNQERLKDLEEKARHDNEKVDRIIWNLLYEGKSIFTNFENAAKKLSDEVLSKPVSKQKEAFQNFWDYFFYSDNIITDNATIFKLGSSNFLELFKCFKVANIDNDMQLKLITFYFEYNDFKEFNLDLLKCMNYCPLKTTDEYLTILNYLNSLQVIGNLSEREEFFEFLNKYIHALTSFSYIHSYKYFYDIKDYIKNQDYILMRFGELLEDLEKIKSRHHQVRLCSTIKDLCIIISFVQKIIEILKCEEEIIIENRTFINTEINSRKINQEEFDRLKQLIESGADNRIDEIEASYIQKKITLYEVDELLEEVKVPV